MFVNYKWPYEFTHKTQKVQELTFLYFNMKKWEFMELCDVQTFTSPKAARSLNLSLLSPSLLSKH